MAAVLRIVTVLSLVVGVAANVYIWNVTGGQAWAWDVMKWPVLLPNIWKNPEDPASIVFAVAIFPTAFATLVISLWFAKMLGTGSKALTKSLAPKPKAAKKPENDPLVEQHLFEARLGAPAPAQEEEKQTKFMQVVERAEQAITDLKDAFGIDFEKWRLNRLKKTGDDKITPVAAKKEGPKGSFWSRLFRRVPEVKVADKPADGKNVPARNPIEERAEQIMTWYATWQNAGPGRRTEVMEEIAYKLRSTFTREVEDWITSRNSYAGLSAIEALLAATEDDKGSGKYAEESAEPVSPPDHDELVDDEMRQQAPVTEDEGSDVLETSDEDLRDTDDDEGGVPTSAKPKNLDPTVMQAFLDQARNLSNNADGSAASMERFKNAGEGSAAGFQDRVKGEGREDGKVGGESASSGSSGSSDDDELFAWEKSGSPASEEKPTPGADEDDGLPADFERKKWSPRPQVNDEQAAGDEPLEAVGDDEEGEGGSGEEYQDEPVTPNGSSSLDGGDDAWKDFLSATDTVSSTPAQDTSYTPVPEKAADEGIRYNEDFFSDTPSSSNATTVEGDGSKNAGGYPERQEPAPATSSAAWGHSSLSSPSSGNGVSGYTDFGNADTKPVSSSSYNKGGDTPHTGGGSADFGVGRSDEEDASVSALLASVSPNGPIGDIADEDLKERPEDYAKPASTVISPAQMDRTIRKMDRNWLRFVTGEIDKGARTIERQFIEVGLDQLKSRNVFLPALWSQLNKVVEYQTEAYAWEHFGDVPPEHLRTASQRKDFLFDAVTAIVSLAKQIPAADLNELLSLKGGTAQAKWLSAGRAQRMVAELKQTGAVEPGRKDRNPEPAAAAQIEVSNPGEVQSPAPVQESADTGYPAKFVAMRDHRVLDDEQIDARQKMSEAAAQYTDKVSLTEQMLGTHLNREEEERSRPVPAETWSEDELREDGEDGNFDDWRNWTGGENASSSDQPSFPSSNPSSGDETGYPGHNKAAAERDQDQASPSSPNGPSSSDDTYSGASPEEVDHRQVLIDEIVARAEKDGIKVKRAMRFKSEGSSDLARTADIVLGKDAITQGVHQIPVGNKVIVINVVDVPEGNWQVGKGENGAPLLKYAGRVIELRTWAFRLAEAFLERQGATEILKTLILRLDPLAMINDDKGNTDKAAVSQILEDGISIRTNIWDQAEWREQVSLPVLS